MLQTGEKKKVTRSISELGRRVTAADVSTKTGLPVLLVSQALNQIASETHGRIGVSQNGDLVYSFSPGFSNAYLASGLRRIVESAGEQVGQALHFVLKVSFGVVLIVSFVIVIFLFLLLFSQKSQTRGGRATTPQLRKNNMFYWIILREAFYALFSVSRRVKNYDYRVPTSSRREKTNFLLDCFSLLFGDGDPNEGLAEKRWQLIAKVIKQHDNVITAEQLAPYTGADPSDEDAVLPVLARFNGKPEVTESGNIIYTFPSLAVTAGGDDSEAAPPYLLEFHCKLTECDEHSLKPVYLVATLNFFGSWALWLLLATKNAPSLSALLTTLVIYGTLFVVVPILRGLWLDIVNRRIDRRNENRARLAELLNSPNESLKKKIAESRDFRLRAERISTNNIVYSTEKNSLEQDDELGRQFAVGEVIDAKPEETFDASPAD